MRKSLVHFLAATAMALSVQQAQAEAAPKLEPQRIETFFVQPGTSQELVWKTNLPEGLVACQVVDYSGTTISNAMATVSADGQLMVPLTLSRGYYEVVIRDQHFGIVAQEAYTKTADPYFGVDAVLTWLERRAPMRESLVKSLKRSGISWSRERMRWVGLNPKPDAWDWNESDHAWDLRQMYAAQKMTVLEMFHDGGSAKGNWPMRNSFPMHLVQMAKAWPTIHQKFAATWGGLEVWNEPDGGYGYGLPADQYVPLVKTMRWTMQQNKIVQPIGGGVFVGTDPSTYHQYCALNGMLDHVDFVSFHDYRRATEMERLVAVYREWLVKNGKESLPLWLTEAGWPWDKGPGRPPVDQDQVSAMEIAWKGIEAKACGVAHYMPFCLAFYEEGGIKSFSMMGKEVTPLRSMGAYLQSVRVLSGRRYAGDLEIAGAVKARVFADENNPRQAVVAIFTNDIGRKMVTIPVAASGAETLDGRAAEINGSKLQIDGGIGYLWVDAANLEGKINPHTRAAELLAASQKAVPAAQDAGSIVLRYVVDPTQETPSQAKYLLSQETASHWHVKVGAYNLSEKSERITLEVRDQKNGNILGQTQQVDVPAQGVSETNWSLDLRAVLDVAHISPIAIVGKTQDGKAISPAVLPVLMEGSLEQFENKFSQMQRLEFANPKLWHTNITSHGQMTMSVEGGSILRTSYTFARPGERWSYPKLDVPERALAGKKGILIRARTQDAAAVRIILFEKQGGGYWTNSTIIPTDGKWHTAYLAFDEFETLPSHPDKVNFQLDVQDVHQIGIGMHDLSKDQKNALEISDLRIVSEKP